MISFDFHHLGAFFHPKLSRFSPCSPSFEGAILDSKLENVDPTLSSLLGAEAYAWNMHRSFNSSKKPEVSVFNSHKIFVSDADVYAA